MRNLFYILLALIVLSSCNIKVDNEDLGDSYFYLSEFEAMDRGFPLGSVIYKSVQKDIINQENIKLNKNIIDVDLDNNFIVVLKKSSTLNLQYYVINKKNDSLYGPFNKSNYGYKKFELGVSENLSLSD